jgi:hypothetical protein
LKSINRTIYLAAAALLLLAGIGIIIMAFRNTPLEMQIVIGFIGLGFVALSSVPLGLARAELKTDERFGQLMAKIDEMNDSIRKGEEKPKKSGVAIADIITSGMKLYSDYKKKDKDKGNES